MATEVEKRYFTLEDDEALGGQREYWRRVAESDGFDIEGIPTTPFYNGLIRGYNSQLSTLMPRALLVNRYAMLGLHHYNMLEGSSFYLGRVTKYNKLQNGVSSYYITLDAVVRPRQALVWKIFQVRVDERRMKRLDVTCSIARPKNDKATTKEPFIPHFHGCAVPDSNLFNGELPDWPSDDALSHNKRFYVLKESEWRARGADWINLYLELLICTNDSESAQITPNFMSNVRIVKVAIETDIGDMKPLNERLKANCANVYITFKGLDTVPLNDEIGEHVERKALVRRVIGPGFLTLVGKHWSSKNAEKRSVTLMSGEKAQRSRKRYRFV